MIVVVGRDDVSNRLTVRRDTIITMIRMMMVCDADGDITFLPLCFTNMPFLFASNTRNNNIPLCLSSHLSSPLQ